MTRSSKSAINPKYSIDESDSKYLTRYERLFNILFYAKELPSDLYTQMNMSHDNYRKAISILNQRGLIKKISKDGAIGHILTEKGKNITRQLDYMKYKDCITDNTEKHLDILRRKRRRQFAYLYALFDRAGIPYESFAKPPITKVTISDNRIYFYTALDLKRMLGIEATVFMGSRLLGFFIGRGKIIPVYRTNQLLKTFGRPEALIPDLLKRHFTVQVDTAVLICESYEAVADISNQIIHNTTDEGINTAHYKYFYIFPSDDGFLSHFSDLYTNHKNSEHHIIEQYHVSTSDKNSKGRHRTVHGTGFINGVPILICSGNINLVKAKKFIRDAELTNNICYIVCLERDKGTIEAITKIVQVKLIIIKSKERSSN